MQCAMIKEFQGCISFLWWYQLVLWNTVCCFLLYLLHFCFDSVSFHVLWCKCENFITFLDTYLGVLEVDPGSCHTSWDPSCSGCWSSFEFLFSKADLDPFWTMTGRHLEDGDGIAISSISFSLVSIIFIFNGSCLDLLLSNFPWKKLNNL